MASLGGEVYYCHQCQGTVRPANPMDLVCPDCNGGFLEEWSGSVDDGPSLDDTSSSLLPNYNIWDFMAPNFGQLLEDMSSVLLRMQTTQTAHGLGLDEEGWISPGTDVGGVDPILLLRAQIQNMFNMRNAEMFIDNGTGGGPRRLQGNIGDYFFGPGLEQLIQQLADNDPNRYGAPPAAKSAVQNLATVKISEEHLGTDAAQCAVCKDEFELCSEVKQMPCKHMYHPDCILPWLAQHNSCPVCRYELPTDDPDYEQARARGFTVASSENASIGARGEGERGPGGFSIWDTPEQFPIGTLPINPVVEASEQQNAPANVGSSGPPQGGNSGGSGGSGVGTGRRFSIAFPWFRGMATTSQSPANATESSSQANSGETVSSGPVLDGNDTPGQTSSALRRDDDGDAVMSETRQEDVDYPWP